MYWELVVVFRDCSLGSPCTGLVFPEVRGILLEDLLRDLLFAQKSLNEMG